MANERKLDFVILGLLSHESLTGYEIKKRMDGTLSFFWGASFGSIYPILNKLAKENKVTRQECKESGREKLVYTITEEGREELRKWLNVPVTRDELRFGTLLKLFFGNEVGPEVTIGHLMEFEKKTKEGMPFLKQSVEVLDKIKDQDETHLYYMLTAKFGVMVYETYLKWCEEAKQVLEERENKK